MGTGDIIAKGNQLPIALGAGGGGGISNTPSHSLLRKPEVSWAGGGSYTNGILNSYADFAIPS